MPESGGATVQFTFGQSTAIDQFRSDTRLGSAYAMMNNNIYIADGCLKLIDSSRAIHHPQVDSKLVPASLIPMIKKCCHENPNERPNIAQVKSEIFRQLQITDSDKLLARILDSIQNYTHDLEDKIQDRTVDLLMERRRCDDLLHQMFPRYICIFSKLYPNLTRQSLMAYHIYLIA